MENRLPATSMKTVLNILSCFWGTWLYSLWKVPRSILCSLRSRERKFRENDCAKFIDQNNIEKLRFFTVMFKSVQSLGAFFKLLNLNGVDIQKLFKRWEVRTLNSGWFSNIDSHYFNVFDDMVYIKTSLSTIAIWPRITRLNRKKGDKSTREAYKK
jgi:hypothetical protein